MHKTPSLATNTARVFETLRCRVETTNTVCPCGLSKITRDFLKNSYVRKVNKAIISCGTVARGTSWDESASRGIMSVFQFRNCPVKDFVIVKVRKPKSKQWTTYRSADILYYTGKPCDRVKDFIARICSRTLAQVAVESFVEQVYKSVGNL